MRHSNFCKCLCVLFLTLLSFVSSTAGAFDPPVDTTGRSDRHLLPREASAPGRMITPRHDASLQAGTLATA